MQPKNQPLLKEKKSKSKAPGFGKQIRFPKLTVFIMAKGETIKRRREQKERGNGKKGKDMTEMGNG